MNMKYSVFSVSLSGCMDYVGTWIATSYESAVQMITKETGLDICSLKIYSRM
jgi:hypothetical protein